MENNRVDDGYLGLLKRNRAVRQVWLAQIVSELGDWLNFVALMQIIKQFSGTAQASGLLIILQMMPLVVFSPFSGALADKFDRRKIMIVCDLLRAVIVLGLLTINRPEQLWLLYLLSAMQFSLTAFFEPARGALIPNLAKDTELLKANALSGVTWSVILAVGGALGGFLFDLVGGKISFLVDSGTFLISASLLLRLNIEVNNNKNDQEDTEGKNTSTSFWAIIPYLLNKPQVLAVTLVKSGICLTGGAVLLLSVVYGQQVFPIGKDGAISVGLLHGAHGLGAVVGAIVTGRLIYIDTKKALNIILLAFALRGLFFWCWGNSPNILLAAISTTSISACGSFLWVISTTLLQKLTEDEIRGRIFALENGLLTLSVAVSIAILGRIIDVWHFPVSTATFAVAFAALAIALVWVTIMLQWQKWDKLQKQNT
jgi:MFS family permease